MSNSTELLKVSDIMRRLEERDLLNLARRISHAHGVLLEEMLSDSHCPAYVTARRIFWAVLYSRGHWSTSRIGELVRRDHSTILASIRKADPAVVAKYAEPDGRAV